MAGRKIYAPIKYTEDAFFNRLNVITNNVDSAIENVKTYVDEKLDNINEYRPISVFEEANDVLVSPNTFTYIPFKTLISDSYFTKLNELGSIELIGAGLYKIELIIDINGDYTNGYVELIVETGTEDTVNELVVKKHYLRESLVNSIIKSFDGGERVKIRITGGVNEFHIRTSVVVDKMY